MNRTTVYVIAVLVLSLSLAGVAVADKGAPPIGPNSLSASGAGAQFQPKQGPTHPPAALITDGSFENGPPPASAWTEVTNSTCEWIGDWSGVWGVAAYDGIMDFWAGGYCGGTPATSSVSQSAVAVPLTDNALTFWYMTYRPDPDDVDPDTAYVQINGTDVFTLALIQANDTYPNWVTYTVDMTAYAGQNVSLTAGAISQGASTGNIRYDYFFFGTPPPPPARCPDGYHEVSVMTQDFSGSFPPAGWTVVNNGGSCTTGASPVWVNNDPGARGNLTGGTGEFAIADSDYCGSGSTMDTELQTDNMNFTNVLSPTVTFRHDYYALGDNADVDVSTDGGATWTTQLAWTSSHRGPASTTVALTGAGQSNVKVRWHYYNASWAWWYEVDDVSVTACVTDNPTSVTLSAVDARATTAQAAFSAALGLMAVIALGGLTAFVLKRKHS